MTQLDPKVYVFNVQDATTHGDNASISFSVSINGESSAWLDPNDIQSCVADFANALAALPGTVSFPTAEVGGGVMRLETSDSTAINI